MPNGFAEKRDAVWKRSRLWRVIWDIGDGAYYIGLLGSIIAPLIILAVAVRHFESWLGLLANVFRAVVALLTCFPLGVGWSFILRQVAEFRTGAHDDWPSK
jgi:hypothetical protein